MIIQSSQIVQESAHSLKIQHKETAYRRETVLPAGLNDVQITLSREARSMAESRSVSAAALTSPPPDAATPKINTPGEISDALQTEPSAEDQAKLDILLKTVELITGKKFHFSKIGVTLSKNCGSDAPNEPPETGQQPVNNQEAPENRVRLIETYTEMTHSEQEATAVEMSGVVKTADGREISLNVNLNMARAYHAENAAYSLTVAPLTDPLVINYSGNAADLTESKYEFDLNMDGAAEQISFVSPGSGGFLALDRNKDGVVNNGSELFGATTGNGFAELSGYDEDGNGWIDAGDSIFLDLSVWEKDARGEDRLVALADTGIGAIYLTPVDSPFRVTDIDNETLGQVRSTGVYLNEDGGTGTVQQIDLAT